MFKYALAAGIAFGMTGPSVNSLLALAFASIRVLCATLLAWMALEAARALLKGILAMDGRAPGAAPGTQR